jgi:hypothetical protein
MMRWVFAMVLAAAACGDEEETSSSSSSSCQATFECSGGACGCTTSGKQGTSCCDPDDCGTDSNNCNDVCKVCN